MAETTTKATGCVKCGRINLPTIGHEPCPGPLPNTHNSATSTAWSFDHPDEAVITPEQFIGLAYEAFKAHVKDIEKIVKEEGILAISEYVIDIFDQLDETLNEEVTT